MRNMYISHRRFLIGISMQENQIDISLACTSKPTKANINKCKEIKFFLLTLHDEGLYDIETSPLICRASK